MRFRALSRTYALLGVLRWALTGAAAADGALLKADAASVSQNLGPTLGAVVRAAQINAWWLIFSLLLLAWLAKSIRDAWGSPHLWRIVQTVLDDFRQHVFGDVAEDVEHHHRVTLFKRKQWRLCRRRWPWSGWLVPVARSGHTTQHSSSVFLAPDAADRCEGVVGRVWSAKRMISVSNLPDLSSPAASDQDFEEYSKKTWNPKQGGSKFRFGARSYVGLPVEVNGQLWGALILDSRNADIGKKKVIRNHYRIVARSLGQILEGL